MNLVASSLGKFMVSILILLITLNLGWLLMFVRVSSHLAVVRNISKTLFNYESFLLLGNLSLFILLMAYILGTKSLREILGRKS